MIERKIISRSSLRVSMSDAVANASTSTQPMISDDFALTSMAKAAPQNCVAPTATVTSAISTVQTYAQPGEPAEAGPSRRPAQA